MFLFRIVVYKILFSLQNNYMCIKNYKKEQDINKVSF